MAIRMVPEDALIELLLEDVIPESEKRKQIEMTISEEISKQHHDLRISVITTVLTHLYDYNHKELLTDFIKILILNCPEKEPQNRFEILKVLMRSVNFYTKGDYSRILSYLKDMAEMEEDPYNFEDLPFQ